MLLHYHWNPKLSDAIGLSYAELGALIERQTDRRLSRWQLWWRLHVAQWHGYHVLPLCDDHDDWGLCKGHTYD